MDVKGFMSKLRAQVGFHRNDRTGQRTLDSDDDSLEEDVMYEGFVVVRDGLKEQMSVDGLPTYSAMMMEPYQRDPSPGMQLSPCIMTQRSTEYPAPTQSIPLQSGGNVIHSAVSPVGDIPFKLHPNLCLKHRAHQIFCTVDLHTSTFDRGRYSYDFTNEHDCLKDFC